MAKLKYTLPLILLLILIGISIVACSQLRSEEAATENQAAVGTSLVTEDEISSDVSVEAMEGGEGAFLSEDAAPNYCLECHADQQALIDTADPIEVAESENEGEG